MHMLRGLFRLGVHGQPAAPPAACAGCQDLLRGLPIIIIQGICISAHASCGRPPPAPSAPASVHSPLRIAHAAAALRMRPSPLITNGARVLTGTCALFSNGPFICGGPPVCCLRLLSHCCRAEWDDDVWQPLAVLCVWCSCAPSGFTERGPGAPCCCNLQAAAPAPAGQGIPAAIAPCYSYKL